jgi:hypothetical protein
MAQRKIAPRSQASAGIAEGPQTHNLDIHYDPAADVLYCSFGPPQEAVGEEVNTGVVIRRNPETNTVVGFTVVDFSKRFAAQPANVVSVPLDSPNEKIA